MLGKAGTAATQAAAAALQQDEAQLLFCQPHAFPAAAVRDAREFAGLGQRAVLLRQLQQGRQILVEKDLAFAEVDAGCAGELQLPRASRQILGQAQIILRVIRVQHQALIRQGDPSFFAAIVLDRRPQAPRAGELRQLGNSAAFNQHRMPLAAIVSGDEDIAGILVQILAHRHERVAGKQRHVAGEEKYPLHLVANRGESQAGGKEHVGLGVIGILDRGH